MSVNVLTKAYATDEVKTKKNIDNLTDFRVSIYAIKRNIVWNSPNIGAKEITYIWGNTLYVLKYIIITLYF